MIRIRILRAQAVARVRSLVSEGVGGFLVAVAIVGASLFGSGDAGDGGSSSEVAAIPYKTQPAGEMLVAGPPAEKLHDVSPERPPGAGTSERDMAERDTAGHLASTASPVPLRGDVAAEARRREGGYPSNFFQLPPSVDNALVFDLRDNRMYIYEVSEGTSTAIGDYFVAVGKNGIEKRREGDEKTPVGIYFVTSYIPGDSLPAIYGVGAFPISYPNAWDRRLGRTGSGIWIHGTDKDEASLLPQSSRGCLTLHNVDFMTLSQFVRIKRTPVIVSDAVSWTTPAELEADRVSLAAAVEAWRSDWESLNNDAYFRHYSESFRTDSMSRSNWVTYKRRVNSSKSYIRVGIDDLGIYAYPGESDLFLVTFDQRYQSNNYQAQKWKHQYWRREAGDWRIVHESGT